MMRLGLFNVTEKLMYYFRLLQNKMLVECTVFSQFPILASYQKAGFGTLGCYLLAE
jgi:hypothetical protein